MSSRDLGDLSFANPRGPAAVELTQLVEQHRRARARLDEIDDEQRRASEGVAAAADAVAQLERRSAVGEKVSRAEGDKAEQALVEATVAAQRGWPARRAGAEAAIRDTYGAVQLFVGANLDELLAEVSEDGARASDAVDDHCRALLDAFAEREAAAARLTALVAMVRNVKPGDVSRSAAERVAREAEALLERGGETRPEVVADPRLPRGGNVPEATAA